MSLGHALKLMIYELPPRLNLYELYPLKLSKYSSDSGISLAVVYYNVKLLLTNEY
jgi:hypothetical protein